MNKFALLKNGQSRIRNKKKLKNLELSQTKTKKLLLYMAKITKINKLINYIIIKTL